MTDGTEVGGWNITSELYGKIVISSNPWKNDTDEDELSSYDEYYASTNPRDTDTDNDGFSDLLDRYPLNWDYDER
ncbi:MAG: hypothetical protein ACFFG0_36440 [Candidatus Thorarchaeota archaeon]